jgi:hypothetical protein
VLLLPLIAAAALSTTAEVKTLVDHNDNEHAKPEFKFQNVPSPSKDDAATKAKFAIVEGERDPNSGELDKLNDGKLPTEEDQPGENFFFNAGTEGGRFTIDLEKAIDVKQVNTYSWHPNTRGPQLYKLYGADGAAADFKADPKKDVNPEKCGWHLVASVDTRPKEGDEGGQYGVSISDSTGNLGKFRYLLFDCARTEDVDLFGNTFYSEIDVIAAAGDAKDAAAPAKAQAAAGGKVEIAIDTSQVPELAEWADQKLRPVLEEWYPKIVAELPSDGYTAPVKFSVTFLKDGKGVAYTAGTRVVCAADWFEKNLEGEAVGAVVHELVHVVQQYRGRANPAAARNPGWLVEGVADYVRWYQYEPESKRPHPNPARAKYTDSYRTTASFLNFVTDQYDDEIVPKLNAVMREGKYAEGLWKEYTGKTADELAQEWKETLGKKPA